VSVDWGTALCRDKNRKLGHHEGSAEIEMGYELEGFCRDVNKVRETGQFLLCRLEVFVRSVEDATNVRKSYRDVSNIFTVVPCILLQFRFISPTHALVIHTISVLIH